MRLSAFCLLGLLATAPAAQAQQGVSLATGFTDFTSWTLAGSATASNATPGNGFTYSTLALTAPGTGGQGGSGFAPTALTMDFNLPFSFDFYFFIPTNAGVRGDGLSFVMSTSPGLGNAGSGLGYEGLGASSAAFAVDTFNFDGEPVSPSLQILTQGSITPLAATQTGLGDTIRDPDLQWYASVLYTPSGNSDNTGMLSGRIEHLNLGNFEVSATVDFDALGLVGSPVYYGFTGANGLATDGHFITSAMPVPEADSRALLLIGTLALGGWLRRYKKPQSPRVPC